MNDKDTRPRCYHCGQRIDWDTPKAAYGTKRAHWSCEDAASPIAKLMPQESHAQGDRS
jgi:hypothetical protein